MFSKTEIELANKTSRTQYVGGSVGGSAVVPRLISDRYPTGISILDFGSGKYPLHTIRLREKGYNVTPYDFGNNLTKLHVQKALSRKYDLVFMSNVLNVQSSPKMIATTMNQIKDCMKKSGECILNYPTSPRKLGWSNSKMEKFLSKNFYVERIPAKTTVVWILKHPVIRTAKGTVIERSRKYGVGKQMGSNIYVHKSSKHILGGVINKIKSLMPKNLKYEVIKYNETTGNISFINSPDWNTADEPTVGTSILIKPTGVVNTTVQKSNPQIYHHKWLFVNDGYTGFNVEESKKRSIAWLKLPNVPSSILKPVW